MAETFQDFRAAIAELPLKQEYAKSDLMVSRFRLFQDEQIACYYVPFEGVNPSARVAIIGITPGWTQMELAYRTARSALELGLPDAEVIRRVDLSASFAGTMRNNLVKMLDGIGLHVQLRLSSCSDLFSDSCDLVHTTSAIRMPTFTRGRNYTGSTPGIVNHPELRRRLLEDLSAELSQAPGALIVPLGKAVSTALEFLVQKETLDPHRCLSVANC
ncbi:MAG: hypothetical protein ACLQAT_07230 [Candidatus Binataceae bacterium]